MPIRLVYLSTLKPDVIDSKLDDLIANAAEFNRKHGITGILALEDRRVCQILEGPDAAVEDLFASIQNDPRHSGVVEIVHTSIDRITFENWGMVRRPMIDMVMVAFSS